MKNKFIKLFILFVVSLLIFSCSNLPTISKNEDEDNLVATLTYTAMELETAQAQIPQEEIESEADSEEVIPSDTPEPPAETEQEVEEATITPEPSATVEHHTKPGEPPAGRESGVTDSNSSATAGEGRAAAGEDFSSCLFERPFTSETMQYRPDIDIIKTTLSRASDWAYVQLEMQGTHPDGGLQGWYGMEFDLDLDGRGDILVLAHDLQGEWSTANVFAWEDSNNDVGAAHPLLADSRGSHNGYDQEVFNQGYNSDPDLVWARLAPSNPRIAQFAFKYSLIKNDGEFLWWGLSDGMVHEAGQYNYNDYFTHEQAGSPLKGLSQYPLKELAEIDNTCRWSVGFVPDGSEPGICYVPATPTPTMTPTVTPTSPPPTGSIQGKFWIENSGDQNYAHPPDDPAVGKTITAYQGACSGASRTDSTNGSGDFGFSDIAPGQYCVVSENLGCHYQTGAQTVTVTGGGVTYVNFYCVPVP